MHFNSMRRNYNTFGVQGYYERVSLEYRNPHFAGVVAGVAKAMHFLAHNSLIPPSSTRCLDVACGSGEATIALQRYASRSEPALSLEIDACDPYLQPAYLQRVGRPASSFSFDDIAAGCLLDGDSYFLSVCSFAAHLIKASMLFATLSQLALRSQYLLVLAPHKKPRITEAMGWEAVDIGDAIAEMRVHVRMYKSLMYIN